MKTRTVLIGLLVLGMALPAMAATATWSYEGNVLPSLATPAWTNGLDSDSTINSGIQEVRTPAAWSSMMLTPYTIPEKFTVETRMKVVAGQGGVDQWTYYFDSGATAPFDKAWAFILKRDGLGVASVEFEVMDGTKTLQNFAWDDGNLCCRLVTKP